jgi:hypothetical protein
MTDREILQEVYRRLKESDDPHGYKTNPLKDGITSFIEREWQREDEKVTLAMYNRNKKPEDWIMDVSEIERHRGLEIGEDGTVKDLK